MRNFGNESFPIQHYLPHHQFAPPAAFHPLSVPSGAAPAVVKMEPYHLAKNVGAGGNLKQGANKSHYSPVSIVTPSPHYGSHHLSSNNCTNSSSNNNDPKTPINLGHGQASTAATVTSETPAAPGAVSVVSHLPTAALAAACPTTAIRGPSPAHHQPSPINALPYHSSHSPTLPIAHTALPSEVHNGNTSAIISSNRSSPLSLYPHQSMNSSSSNSPYHPTQYPMSTYNRIPSTASNTTTTPNPDLTQSNHETGPQPNSNHPGSAPPANSEATRNHPATNLSDDSGNTSNSRTNAAAQTARIVSQNVNGTLAITGIPTNESELQLFRVLQRANLLSYFDCMIELGGDDVQQLCEAGKEEFLEIMALIGMAAKPLHVRRLQKALQEWMTQPSLFQSPVLPAGYQQHLGVSHVDRTISHTHYSTTTITAASATSGSPNTDPTGQARHPPSQSLGPIPHLIPHNTPVSPYPAQNAPFYAIEPPKSSSATISSDTSSKLDDPSSSHNNDSSNHTKNMRSRERESSNSSPMLSSNPHTATIVGLDKVYLQRGSPSLPVVVSTAQSYATGKPGLSSFPSSFSDHFRSCPSPSGSTSSRSSSSSRVSSVSNKSHHQFHHPSSPLESFPASPVNSESGRMSISNKQHEESSTCTELENSSSLSSSSDQTNSIQLLDNSTGTASLRVASRSSSQCSIYVGGSEPGSPASPPSESRETLVVSSAQQTSTASPRPSPESVSNYNNNSVPVTCTTSSQDFFSLQEHEIQKLAETAMNVVRSLPAHVKEPKLSKKIETSSYEYVRRLAEDDPRRMDEIRRLSTIFGKPGENGKKGKGISSSSNMVSPSNKTMSILELVMNEAAAQLCKLLPALLTKRDELFSLARQVIRDSGLPYVVICANSNLPNSFLGAIANNNNDSNFPTSGSNKGKINEIRNSPAHEERISHEFAAACKKIKLDMHKEDRKSATTEACMRILEQHNAALRKSPHRENRVVSATTKRVPVGVEKRSSSCKASTAMS